MIAECPRTDCNVLGGGENLKHPRDKNLTYEFVGTQPQCSQKASGQYVCLYASFPHIQIKVLLKKEQ